MSGPDWCLGVLDAYLATNPASRIVTVLPIEYSIANPEPGVRESGTQELLLVLADAGEWPLAQTLETTQVSCTSAGRGPKSCGAAIEDSAALAAKATFWIPLTRQHSTQQSDAGTQSVIIGWIKP